MNRYGFVVIPSDDAWYYGASYAGVERGIATKHHKWEDIQVGDGFPPTMFFERKDHRDAEMDAYAKKFPGLMFSPFEITGAVKFSVSPQKSEFVISNKGVLPA